MNFSLEQFLVTQLFTALLIFTRVGSGLMLMPGFGEAYVSGRARLLLALAVAVLMTPVLQGFVPPVPGSPLTLTILLAEESFIGLTIGLVARLIISSMHIAGTIIATQAGLAMATQFDPTQATQGSVIGNLLSMTAVLLLFALDLHFMMLQGLFDSYTLFMPGDMLPLEDLTDYITMLIARIFDISLKLSAPILVIGLMLYFGAGAISRLMPNMQIFFVITPIQVVLSLFIMLAVFHAMMVHYTDHFVEIFSGFLEDVM